MKLQNMVRFPLIGLDMTPHVVKRSQSSWSLPSHWSPWRRPYGLGRDPEDFVYDLYAVCNHHGTMQGGHYTGDWAALPVGLCSLPCCSCLAPSMTCSADKDVNKWADGQWLRMPLPAQLSLSSSPPLVVVVRFLKGLFTWWP